MKTRILLLSFIAFTVFTAQAQIPSYVPSNGLVGWWPFNGNANDESGNGNNGTVNGATLTTDRFGNASSAYSFDGVQNYISVNNPMNMPIGNSNRSFSCWFNYSTSIQPPIYNDWSALICYGGFGATCGSNYLLLGNNENVLFGGASSCSSVLISNSVNLINEWHNVVAIYTNNDMYIFIDGVFLSQSNNNSFNTALTDLFFGKLYNQTNANQKYNLNGSLDDIGIWNRALTECEIQDLYHAQFGSQAISAGLDQSICTGESITLNGAGGSNYQWNNNVVDGQAFTPTQSNAYVVTAQDTLGCTGTDTVVVTVLENATSTLTETALDSYTLNGQTYTQSGTYTQTLTSANGCDSTITLNLTLNFTGMDELGTGAKKLVKITDLSGKIIPRRKNTLMLFIYEDGTVERVVEMEE